MYFHSGPLSIYVVVAGSITANGRTGQGKKV